MHFQHSSDLWRDFPDLVPGVLFADGLTKNVDVYSRIAAHTAVAGERLGDRSEAELPEIQAWRRAFSTMGLKPTQYRCAAESLLRRYRKEQSLPRIHPLIDLCNAISLAYAVPMAVFDVSKIAAYLEVRYADGDEQYLSFSGELETPTAGEVIFADDVPWVHARRWTNRQSAYSAVRDTTTAVLIVAEALHESAAADVKELLATTAGELETLWSVAPRTAILNRSSPRFEF
jgi:DNA/RNA-binding domain of Phe-tRNA-synthetase-like protein